MVRFLRRLSVAPAVLALALVSLVTLFATGTTVVSLSAQTQATQPPATPPAPQANPPATPPATPATEEAKAYTDATRITDPAKKIEALEKFLKTYPDSPRKSTAYGALFDTYVKDLSTERAKILEYAQLLIESAPEGFRASGYSRVATRLVDANVMLEDAEKFATEGLQVFDADEKKRLQRSRATHLATLGRIRIKQGRVAEAETALKEAFAANPEIPGAAVGLAELAEKRGDDKAAVDHWMTAALTGRLTAEDLVRFEATYKKVNGSIDGLNAALDAKYKAAYPAPIHPEAYKATPARSNRMVLAEVFTGAGCPPCVSVDLGFDAALERYARKDIAVLMYHLHIPQPDPLTNKWTTDRATYYKISGVPNFAVDGELDNRGGGDRAAAKAAYDRIVPKLDKALESAATAQLALTASLDGSTIKVKATPSAITDGKKVKLQIALVEELMSYSGENGIRFHPMVVRALATGEKDQGLPVDQANPVAADYSFDLTKIASDTKAWLDDYEVNGRHGRITFKSKPVKMDTAKLSVVAFLQDEDSKKVLQSAYVKIGGGTSTNLASR
jgi:tetratricopeptide (TPR) repeat protein